VAQIETRLNVVTRPALRIAELTSSALRLEVETAAGFSYVLEGSNDPAANAWTATAESYVASEAGQATFVIERPSHAQFYRLKIEPVGRILPILRE
jgi:hypothetical protein